MFKEKHFFNIIHRGWNISNYGAADDRPHGTIPSSDQDTRNSLKLSQSIMSCISSLWGPDCMRIPSLNSWIRIRGYFHIGFCQGTSALIQTPRQPIWSKFVNNFFFIHSVQFQVGNDISMHFNGCSIETRGVLWFGEECAARTSKSVPVFKDHFGRKGYPLLRIFLEK